MGTRPPIIAIDGVTKRYGAGTAVTCALDGIALEMAAGEFVSVMGPSGSGKTTLLNVIGGLDVPDSGRVVIDGDDLGRLKDHQLANLRLRKIGFVFQAFNLLPALTIERNVAWPLQFSGYSRAETRRHVDAALRRVGVTNYQGRYPGQLSGGEQQRVAIARAIAPGPTLLLADEPTGNLDSRNGQAILDLLRSLNQSENVSVVMVTHSAFAAAYGHRTLEMQDGRIVRDVRAPMGPRLVSLATREE
jgi:putative ABC transport system ATP-binding protein